MFCRQTVEVWGGVGRINIHVQGRQLFVDLICFQQNIHCKTLRRIFGVVKLQRIIHKYKCAVSEGEILLKIEKKM